MAPDSQTVKSLFCVLSVRSLIPLRLHIGIDDGGDASVRVDGQKICCLHSVGSISKLFPDVRVGDA